MKFLRQRRDVNAWNSNRVARCVKIQNLTPGGWTMRFVLCWN